MEPSVCFRVSRARPDPTHDVGTLVGWGAVDIGATNVPTGKLGSHEFGRIGVPSGTFIEVADSGHSNVAIRSQRRMCGRDLHVVARFQVAVGAEVMAVHNFRVAA